MDDHRRRIQRTLGLRDVYAISTGAMISSGFFLLPGLAADEAGPAVVLAYALSGLLVIPAMLSTAELSAAMPHAGGQYHFIDRGLGPLAGTIAGLGIWATLIAKGAFSLVGIGVYLSILIEMPVQPVAVAVALALVVMNILGSKTTSRLEAVLVAILLLLLAYFVGAGFIEILGVGPAMVIDQQFTPFLPFGVSGLLVATGMVFVSYAGLTQVASLSGSVQRPARNIPLGMILSLITAVLVYVLGVAVLVAVVDAPALRDNLRPIATAAEQFMPQPWGTLAIVAAAVAAFVSTGNASILSASRYPLALARERLLVGWFGKLNRHNTPTRSILVTGAFLILLIIAADVEQIVTLASSFLLLIFGLLNLAVIVFRQAKLDEYQPAFRSPLYPWMQIAGIAVTVVMIVDIGLLAVVASAAMLIIGGLWYFVYARKHTVRRGAINGLLAGLRRGSRRR